MYFLVVSVLGSSIWYEGFWFMQEWVMLIGHFSVILDWTFINGFQVPLRQQCNVTSWTLEIYCGPFISQWVESGGGAPQFKTTWLELYTFSCLLLLLLPQLPLVSFGRSIGCYSWFLCHPGVWVSEFLKDGSFSKDQYLRFKTLLPVNLSNFTVCARVKVFYLRGEQNFFLSYANNVTDDALRGSITTTTLGNGTQVFQVFFCKYPFITQECVNATLFDFHFNHWKHFCAAFTAIYRTNSEVESARQLYVDGNLVNSGNSTCYLLG